MAALASLWRLGILSGSTDGDPRPIVLYSERTAGLAALEANLEGAGVTVARSREEFLATLDQEPSAILLTSPTLGQVDPEWLQAQVAKGLVLGGIDLSQVDLAALIELKPFKLLDGTEAPPPPLDDGEFWGGKQIFTLMYQVDDGQSVTRGAMTDELSSYEYLLATTREFVSETERIRARVVSQ